MSIEESPKQVSPEDKKQSTAKPKEKRIRERHISDVVKAVAVWRRLYHGVFFVDKVMIVRYSLSDAAKKVGIPRKTLDEYLRLLAMGREHGFDFVARREEKIG